MNDTRSLLRQDSLFHPAASLLEMPGVLPMATSGQLKYDTLNASFAFSSTPIHPALSDVAQLPAIEQPPAPVDPDLAIERRLQALRKSPGFELMSNSVLLLKACQLDMDAPPRRTHYLRQKLIEYLKKKTGQPLNPDQLHVTFSTQSHPAVDDHGHEHYSLRLSLIELTLASFDPSRFMALYTSTLEDLPLSAEATLLSAAEVIEDVTQALWSRDYTAELEAFWTRHHATFRLLSRLSFLDTLARQYARGQISRYGYFLTLDALGLKDFPTDVAALEERTRGETCEIHMLWLNDEQVPGIFQVRSNTTSHCFIHVLGSQNTVVEYIGTDPGHMTEKLLAALNDSTLAEYASHLLKTEKQAAATARAKPVDGDVFAELTNAYELLADQLLEHESFDRFDLLRPVSRCMALASAVDLWQTHPAILDQLPEPATLAAQLMADFLREQHNLEHDPDHVFIAYRRGTSTTPLGDARTPSIHVYTPDETPLSLSEALVNQYRVRSPAGYIDHGGRTVTFLDPTGKGEWAEDRALTLDPQALENHIRTIDFLKLMTERIDTFWDQHRTGIEQALRSTLMTQALVALKQQRLTRSAFDRVVSSLDEHSDTPWHELSFYVQGSLIDSLHTQHTGLLLLDHPGKPKVLYQAGHPRAFIELADEDALNRYLIMAAADDTWRETVLRHAPVRHHLRLSYLLKVWSGVRPPIAPASILRPWTDPLYNPDTHKAVQHMLHIQMLDEPPFAFLYRMLKQNALMDAEDRIVTCAQVSLHDWTSRLYHLQMLLAPMSLLLTPALIASLAVEIGMTSVSLAAANLPGGRHAEKDHALLTVLSLGLLHLSPRTPGLLRSFKKLARAPRQTTQSAVTRPAAAKVTRPQTGHSMGPRETRLEKFFHTDALLKRWTLLGTPHFGGVPVHAWKLGRRFLLWTSGRGQARTLVVSTHGHYLPWTGTVKIPNGTEIRTYAPHGHELVDPLLHRIVSQRVEPFAISNMAGNTPVALGPSLTPLVMTDKLMAGTALPGRLKNYSLSKFQTVSNESYSDISHIVRHSNASPFRNQFPPVPMDVLTVRNRFGMPSPTLADLFDMLAAQGIHYDRLLLVHCRCAAISSLLQRAPVYKAPTVKPTIVKMP
ncbi:dermonecrotic toxin domain-containing protein [Pseudomonas viridiflava]|uniref:dermonecrotic toxin domain-containing protein n=1 Tax=Pseudomonas viridiflava TaxID=33069 RepID=UPI0020BD4BB6|nr:DUF6543 domain-containing protein [Pseudomonas viridiflava]